MSPTHPTRNPNITMLTFWWSRWTIRHGCPPTARKVPSQVGLEPTGFLFPSNFLQSSNSKKPLKSQAWTYMNMVFSSSCLKLSRALSFKPWQPQWLQAQYQIPESDMQTHVMGCLGVNNEYQSWIFRCMSASNRSWPRKVKKTIIIIYTYIIIYIIWSKLVR